MLCGRTGDAVHTAMADHAVRGAALILDLGVDVDGAEAALAVGSHLLVEELLAVLIGVVPLVETALTVAVALDPGRRSVLHCCDRCARSAG